MYVYCGNCSFSVCLQNIIKHCFKSLLQKNKIRYPIHVASLIIGVFWVLHVFWLPHHHHHHRRSWFGAQIRAAALKLSAAQSCAGNAQPVAAATRNFQFHWNFFSLRWPNCKTASSGQVVFVWVTWSLHLFLLVFSSYSFTARVGLALCKWQQ